MKSYDTVVIDGFNRCYKYGWTYKNLSSHGRPSGMLFGFLKFIFKARELGDRVVVVWDTPRLRKQWSHPGYKQDSDDPQVTELRRILPVFGVEQTWAQGQEADDVAALIVKRHETEQPGRLLLVSDDSDWYIMMTSRVDLYRDSKIHAMADIARGNRGLTPFGYRMFLALTGTHNGLPGIGIDKEVAILVSSLAMNIDGVFWDWSLNGVSAETTAKLREKEDVIRENFKIIDFIIEGYTPEVISGTWNSEQAQAFLSDYEMRSLLGKLA